MSIKLMAAAWDLDIGSTEKMVLMCLCDYANDEGGNCWPAVGTIARKCSKSVRTVQVALKWLQDNGFLTTTDVPGKSHKFHLDPRKICTPAETAPPQKTTQTPAKSAPKPPRTTSNKQTARVMPEGWQPEPFGMKSKCRPIVESWSSDELETQIEHFTVHHRGKGNRFVDWQDAWKTWVLNSRKWGARSPARAPPAEPISFVDHVLAKQKAAVP